MKCKCGSTNVSEYDAEQKGQFMHSFVICNDCQLEFVVTYLECHHSYDPPMKKVVEDVVFEDIEKCPHCGSPLLYIEDTEYSHRNQRDFSYIVKCQECEYQYADNYIYAGTQKGV